MFKAAEIIIAEIEKDCEKTGGDLRVALDGLNAVSCTADIDGKDDAFQKAADALKQGREDCPDHDKEFDALDELLIMAQAVKCGGG